MVGVEAVAAEALTAHLVVVAVVVLVRSPQTLLAARQVCLTPAQVVAPEMPELILRREAAVAVDISLRIAHALEPLS